MRKFISWGIFMLVLAAGVILVQPLSVVIVDGHSMEPTYHHDDLVLAYERESYAVGDVIVYDANVAGQFNVVHRVIEPTEGGFITQGDNVPEPDFWIAEHERIHGSVFLHIPRGGIAAQWLRQPFVILSLFLGWAAFEFMRAREKEQSDRKNEYRELEDVS